MHTLHLTKDEQKLFAKLPAELTKELSVEQETMTYEDSPRRRGMRFALLAIKDPELVRLQESMRAVQSEADVMKALQSFDLTKIHDADFTQMLFAMGPNAIGVIIENLLTSTSNAEDMEVVTAYSLLRHDMLESLTLYSPKEP